MKIALICTPRDVHARKWATALAQAGVEVLFCCPEPEAEPIPGCRVIPVPGTKKHAWSYVDFWLSAPALQKILKQEKPDLVQALHVTPFGVWARLAAYHPLTLMALGADILEYSSGKARDTRWTSEQHHSAFRKNIAFLWHRYQVKKTLKAADQIWADNEVLKQELIRLLPKAAYKTDVFTWGIDLHLWQRPSDSERTALKQQLGLPADKIIVLCPRGLKPVYQGEQLLKLVESNPPESPLFWIVLKGNYPIPQPIQEKLNHIPKNQALIITETLPKSRIVCLFHAADACLSLPVYDGLSASLLQAMACGLDLFVSDIPATRELEQKGVHLTRLMTPISEKPVSEIIVNWYKQIPYDTQNENRTENLTWIKENADLSRQTQFFLSKLSKSALLAGRPADADRLR